MWLTQHETHTEWLHRHNEIYGGAECRSPLSPCVSQAAASGERYYPVFIILPFLSVLIIIGLLYRRYLIQKRSVTPQTPKHATYLTPWQGYTTTLLRYKTSLFCALSGFVARAFFSCSCVQWLSFHSSNTVMWICSFKFTFNNIIQNNLHCSTDIHLYIHIDCIYLLII